MKILDIRFSVKNGKVILYFPPEAPRVRILREKTEPAKLMECDRERTPEGADVIFEGCPERLSAHYMYRDDTTEVNGLYDYWIAELFEDGETLCHPVLVRVRDEEIWWPREKYERYMEEIHRDFPDRTEIIECGRTTRGYPLRYIVIGSRDRCAAYLGAVHAGESGPELLLPAAGRILSTTPELFDACGAAILPAVNADCREDMVEGVPQYIRTNPNGVDLNRNFPADWEIVNKGYGLSTDCFLDGTYRGRSPASESETRAVIAMMEAVKPMVILSYHWLCGICEDRLLISEGAREDEAYMGVYRQIMDAFHQGFIKGLGLPPRKKRLEPCCTPGSLPHWGYLRGIPAFDVEGNYEPQFMYPEFEGCATDQTTREMLALALDCHEGAMRSILKHISGIEKPFGC